MQSAIISSRRKEALHASLFAALAFLILISARDAKGQATVESLTGSPSTYSIDGFAGFQNGPFRGEVVFENGILTSDPLAQFDTPSALALGIDGDTIYVADSANDAVRAMDLGKEEVTTFIALGAGANPIDIKVNAEGDIYVLSKGFGMILRYNKFGNFLGALNLAALTAPNAFDLDSSGNVYVVEAGGALKMVNGATGVVTVIPVAGGGTVGGLFSAPRGIAVLDNGSLAVSDSGSHVVRFLGNDGVVTQTLGTMGTSGLGVGIPTAVLFNSPGKIAKAGGDVLVLADTLNHRVVQISAERNTTLLHGSAPSEWNTLDDTIANLPGWLDGDGEDAWSRNPEGLMVVGSGDVYVTEVFYHTIRQASSTGLSGPSGSFDTGGTNGVVVNPPAITMTPNSGYYPMGVDVEIASPSTNVFYTTDGSEPTTNSQRVVMMDGKGTISWNNSLADLQSLQVAAFLTVGTNTVSTNITGMAASTNSIGVTQNIVAGPGATIFVPVVINLVEGQTVDAIAYKFAVRPDMANGVPTPIAAGQLGFQSSDTNSFVLMAVAAANPGEPVTYQISDENFVMSTMERSVDLAALGGGNFQASGFNSLGVFKITIPDTVAIGDVYHIEVKNVSATSGENQEDVEMGLMPQRTITISDTVSYIVGNTAPGTWYNAGDFGDAQSFRSLKVNDLNNVFLASQNIRKPFSGSDAFDAMDAHPSEANLGGLTGGNKDLNVEDWETIWDRVLGNDTNNFARKRELGGAISFTSVGSNFDPNGTANEPESELQSGLLGNIWTKQARMIVSGVDFPEPGEWIQVPIRIDVFEGVVVDSIGMTITVSPLSFAPALNVADGVSWVPASGIGPLFNVGVENGLALGWHRQFSGSVKLGDLRFRIPSEAENNDAYRVSISFLQVSQIDGLEGSGESFSNSIIVGAAASEQEARVSDEWFETFMSSLPTDLAGLYDDADSDGFLNWQEFLAGTDPTDAESTLGISATKGEGEAIVLRWLSSSQKNYVIEYSTDLGSGAWTQVATITGDGNFISLPQVPTEEPRFYRIRLLEQ